jgi:hypothetical protein
MEVGRRYSAARLVELTVVVLVVEEASASFDLE